MVFGKGEFRCCCRNDINVSKKKGWSCWCRNEPLLQLMWISDYILDVAVHGNCILWGKNRKNWIDTDCFFIFAKTGKQFLIMVKLNSNVITFFSRRIFGMNRIMEVNWLFIIKSQDQSILEDEYTMKSISMCEHWPITASCVSCQYTGDYKSERRISQVAENVIYGPLTTYPSNSI